MRFLLGYLLLLGLSTSLYGQTQMKKQIDKAVSTTKNTVDVTNVEKGGLFLEIKSYFEEFSTTKPGSITQLYWIGQQRNGELEIRYVFTNLLLDFHVETTLLYAISEKQILELNIDRRVPFIVEFKLKVEENKLKIELL